MTSKEILSSFSQTLLQDERILSVQERELLSNLLEYARAKSEVAVNGSVAEVIAHAVGETVAQRAFTVLGGQIVEQILGDRSSTGERNSSVARMLSGPRPPSPAPGPGTVESQHMSSGPRPPSPAPGPGTVESQRMSSGPRPPSPSPGPGTVENQRMSSGPRPPSPAPGPGTLETSRMASDPRVQKTSVAAESSNGNQAASVAVLERSEILPARFVVLDEFLVPEELKELTEYALSREADFVLSEVIAPGDAGSLVDYEHRRSRVLMDVGQHQAAIVNRIEACLPRVLQKLDREQFSVSRVETQMTASNDGDFFRHHNDNGQGEIASRELTFVYFFHREPKAFSGGELRIYDSRLENGGYVSTGNYHTIVPRQNQIVFFPSALLHEITAVECPSRAFADSRFTVNGWFHR